MKLGGSPVAGSMPRDSLGAVVSRPEVPYNRAALVLLGIVFLALAAGISSTWVDDGDGTCRALYRPNLGRVGCARKLAPAAFVSAALLGAGALSWDAARRRTRPSAGEIVGVVIASPLLPSSSW